MPTKTDLRLKMDSYRTRCIKLEKDLQLALHVKNYAEAQLRGAVITSESLRRQLEDLRSLVRVLTHDAECWEIIKSGACHSTQMNTPVYVAVQGILMTKGGSLDVNTNA